MNVGLRSYGKAVYAFGTLPLLGYLVVCIKILGVSSAFPYSGVVSVLDLTPWREFFTNSRVSFKAALFFIGMPPPPVRDRRPHGRQASTIGTSAIVIEKTLQQLAHCKTHSAAVTDVLKPGSRTGICTSWF